MTQASFWARLARSLGFRGTGGQGMAAGVPAAWGGAPFRFHANCTLLIPPIALGDYEQLEERIKAQSTSGRLSAALVIDGTHAALRRNYPRISREEVGSLVDVSTMQPVWMTVMGMTLPAQKGERSPGEAPGP